MSGRRPLDHETLAAYEAGAATYAARRSEPDPDRAAAFVAAVGNGLRVDLGCGPGLAAAHLGRPLMLVDTAVAMLHEAHGRAPDALAVRADLRSLPFRRGSVAGVWASKAHQHLAASDLPAALGELHRVLPVGGRLDLALFAGPPGSEPGTTWRSDDEDDLPGRAFTWWDAESLEHLLTGAGFESIAVTASADGFRPVATSAVRARSLADTVGAGLRLLVCGLNPSVNAADAGVGFARPGNRFWPALRAADLTSLDRDPAGLLARDRIGMTDLVKRATVRADELDAQEYRAGIDRLDHLCALLRPAAACMVGLAGWRAAVDRRATAGWQARRLGGTTPVYVMPSTSGLNARTGPDELAGHLRAAADGPVT